MNWNEVKAAAALSTNDVASDTKIDAKFPYALDFVKVKNDGEEEISLSVGKEEKEAFKSSTPRIVDNLANNGDIGAETDTQIYIGEEPRAVTAESRKWEIIKSIVYGGLIESITSLGVVFSAAGSGTAPLNIIALGLANLIGGLLIIGHDPINLKNSHSEEERYQEQLGARENFLLHAVVAVLSFLIFGYVPLVVYGLQIHKNYYIGVNLAVVLVTSVACIILLAIAKNYTRNPPKSYIKTVLQYVILALATSGVSYIAGDLIKNLLEKLSVP
ncbi:hypothetical protein PIB30_070683 [Stylosanthes scabra]|uniref:Vacuolar iron transporter n=1 Tax=Stylosanthes scabra TaxID=79078 RepID=A0ABU6QNC7_9FABA|nr:hypothetical protein [Stylosanthes scabra]